MAVNSKDVVIGRKLDDKLKKLDAKLKLREPQEENVDDEQSCQDEKMCCVMIFSSLGKKIKIFGKFGNEVGEFDTPLVV